MSESMPMISRSDGKNFHLVLADRPLPYPVERHGARSQQLSLCFWYADGRPPSATNSSLVLFPAVSENGHEIYREAEYIADLLAAKLVQEHSLAVLYRLSGNSLRKVNY